MALERGIAKSKVKTWFHRRRMQDRQQQATGGMYSSLQTPLIQSQQLWSPSVETATDPPQQLRVQTVQQPLQCTVKQGNEILFSIPLDGRASHQPSEGRATSIPGSPASVSRFSMNQALSPSSDNGAQYQQQMPPTPPGSDDDSQYQGSPQSQDSGKGQRRSKEGTLCQLCDFKTDMRDTKNPARKLQDHYGKLLGCLMIYLNINSQHIFTAKQHFQERLNRDLYQRSKRIHPTVLYCPEPYKCQVTSLFS